MVYLIVLTFSNRLHNINAAAIAGALVVFDEFHLMEPQKAFLTGAACLHLFRDLCQSVWMTATATLPLENALRDSLATVTIPESKAEADLLLASLPSVIRVTRHITLDPKPLSAESVLQFHGGRSIVLLNTVGRAQAMFKELQVALKASGLTITIILLHSHFFKNDRQIKEEKLHFAIWQREQRPGHSCSNPSRGGWSRYFM